MTQTSWHSSTEHEIASMSEGHCPRCASRLTPPNAVGALTSHSGVCPVHGWYILRVYPEKGGTLTFVKPHVKPVEDARAS